MLLTGKNAVVYGGGGFIGGAVARAFAREGASVFLAGRRSEPLEAVARDISAEGGEAQVALVDALDERAVDEHGDAVVARGGSLDVSFNAIAHGDVHGAPLLAMPFDDFARPVTVALRTQYLTARAAARHMMTQGSGVILAITATTARHAIPEVGGTGVSFDATESLCRQWACELGKYGVRVVWLRTTGIPEALHDTGDPYPDYGTGSGGMTRDELVEWLRRRTMLKRLTTLAEVGNMAAFIASERASATTGCAVNMTCGSLPD